MFALLAASRMVMTVPEIVGLGFLGGLVPDALRVVKARYGPLPQYLRRRFFWISLAVLGATGALAALLSKPTSLAAALAAGYAAPSIAAHLLGGSGKHDDTEPPLTGSAKRRIKSAAGERHPLANVIGTDLREVVRWWGM